jgi:predicted aspartyl protease
LTHRIAPYATAAAIGLTLASAGVRAGPARLLAAFNGNDLTALEALAGAAAPPAQRQVAAGAVLALRREDAAAMRMLLPVSRSKAAPEVRAIAYLALSSIDLRDGRYRDCYAAMRAASRLSARSVNASDRQAMAFARALAAVKPMRLARAASGSLPITRDKAGLPRVPVRIDGHTQAAIVDTGANFSTISASAARRAGIRMLTGEASVGSSTEQAVATRLGIAPRLRIGDAVLTNVVFIVLPDSALTFANGAYRIEAIIGLPVLMALGRIEFAGSGAKPTFVYGVPPAMTASEARPRPANLLLSGLQPLLLVRVPGASHPLRMVLDTGANTTMFSHNAVTDAPALLAHAGVHDLHVGGAGGTETDRKALRLPVVTLTVDGRRFKLENVAVISRARAGSDGMIGQDLLRQGARVTVDFQSMRLTIAKPPVTGLRPRAP